MSQLPLLQQYKNSNAHPRVCLLDIHYTPIASLLQFEETSAACNCAYCLPTVTTITTITPPPAPPPAE